MGTVSTETRLNDLAMMVVRTQFDALRAHEAGTRKGKDPEELHDMRVATRRLRAALKIFEDALPPDAQAWRKELAWLGRGLAAVRDLDVQLERTDQLVSELREEDASALAVVRAQLEADRAEARTELVAELDSERYRELLRAGEALTASDPEPESGPTIAEAASELLDKSFRKVRELGDTLDSTSEAADLHKLRIRAKRVRYATEFIRPAYGAPAERFVRRLVDLQDVLGEHQDSEVAVARLHALATRTSDVQPGAVFTMGELAQRYRDDGARLRGEFPRAYRRATGKRWRALRRLL
jgi:CHAD domain-containing protein